MRKNKFIYWTYLGQQPRREYNDPRVPVARHIGWQKLFGTETVYCTPEPDNYNKAILTAKPVECVFIEDQVIYKDIVKGLWCTLMYVPEDQMGEYETWMNRLQPDAHWQHKNPPKIRTKKECMA
jgi:hypothetical protein